MLTLQRRHSPRCPDRDKGPNHLKCRGGCLLRAHGTTDDGQRMRLSLKTRDLQRAARRLTEIEDRMSGKPRKKVVDAVASFRTQHDGNADETKRRYKRILRYFTEFCAREALTYHIKSWTKDVELLRQLFEFCRDRELAM
jgi:hypothetical protein